MSTTFICNYDDAEKLWHSAFYNELRVAPEEHPVMMVIPSLVDRATKEKVTQIMFETYNVPAFTLLNAGAASVFASGRVTGMALVSGYNRSTVVPVYCGTHLDWAAQSLWPCGREVTEALTRRLGFTTTAEREIARDIKAALCYVGSRKGAGVAYEAGPRDYELPDGQVLAVTDEARRADAEDVLFGDNALSWGISDAADCVASAHPKECAYMLDNIVLAGGTTLLDGFPDRLQQELRTVLPVSRRTRVIAVPERKYSPWIGASIMSSLLPYTEYISKEEYDESGPVMVHRKCTA